MPPLQLRSSGLSYCVAPHSATWRLSLLSVHDSRGDIMHPPSTTGMCHWHPAHGHTPLSAGAEVSGTTRKAGCCGRAMRQKLGIPAAQRHERTASWPPGARRQVGPAAAATYPLGYRMVQGEGAHPPAPRGVGPLRLRRRALHRRSSVGPTARQLRADDALCLARSRSPLLAETHSHTTWFVSAADMHRHAGGATRHWGGAPRVPEVPPARSSCMEREGGHCL
jgi:hypothetical protein